MRMHRASLQQHVCSTQGPHTWYGTKIAPGCCSWPCFRLSFVAMVQEAAALVQAAGPAQQLMCSPCSSAFVHGLFLVLFAAPDWKSSFPAGSQVKCLRRQVKFHTGRPPPHHSLPNILLFSAVLRIAPCHSLLCRNSVIYSQALGLLW